MGQEGFDIVNLIFGFCASIANLLNRYEFLGVPYFYLLFAFMVTSICISVFWRGGRG